MFYVFECIMYGPSHGVVVDNDVEWPQSVCYTLKNLSDRNIMTTEYTQNIESSVAVIPCKFFCWED